MTANGMVTTYFYCNAGGRLASSLRKARLDLATLLTEVVRPAQADVGLQRNPHDALEGSRIAGKCEYLRGLAAVAAGDQEVGGDRHGVLAERLQHRAAILVDRHAGEAIAQRLGTNVFKFSANPQTKREMLVGGDCVPDKSRGFGNRFVSLGIAGVGLRVRDVDCAAREV